MNELILGDNLEILQKMEAESVDLVYLDPPLFSNRTYEVIWGFTASTGNKHNLQYFCLRTLASK